MSTAVYLIVQNKTSWERYPALHLLLVDPSQLWDERAFLFKTVSGLRPLCRRLKVWGAQLASPSLETQTTAGPELATYVCFSRIMNIDRREAEEDNRKLDDLWWGCVRPLCPTSRLEVNNLHANLSLQLDEKFMQYNQEMAQVLETFQLASLFAKFSSPKQTHLGGQLLG